MRRVIGRKSTEEDRPSKTYLPFQLFCRGIVNLARRWPRGKVAKKARIPVCIPFRLYVWDVNWYDFKRLVFMNCPQCGEVCRCLLEPFPCPSLQERAEVVSGMSSVIAVGVVAGWVRRLRPCLPLKFSRSSRRRNPSAVQSCRPKPCRKVGRLLPGATNFLPGSIAIARGAKCVRRVIRLSA